MCGPRQRALYQFVLLGNWSGDGCMNSLPLLTHQLLARLLLGTGSRRFRNGLALDRWAAAVAIRGLSLFLLLTLRWRWAELKWCLELSRAHGLVDGYRRHAGLYQDAT